MQKERATLESISEHRVFQTVSTGPTISTGVQSVEEDVALRNVEMPLKGLFYPLGFAVQVTTNSVEVLAAARESWGQWEPTQFRPTLQLRIAVTQSDTDGCPPRPVICAQQHLMSIVADAQNHAVCDLRQGFAFARVSEAAVQHRSYLRYHFIEAAAMTLISSLYATPVHAACVSLAGQGFLLCGDSGAGKSSLSYACARAGWTYTTDDASYLVVNADGPRIVGNSHQVRFRPSAAKLFPELRGRDLTPRAEGKPSMEVPTAELPGIITAAEAAIHHVVFLNRRPAALAELTPYSSEAALHWFQQSLFPVPEVRELQAQALQRLLDTTMYELSYCDLDRAVHCLELLALGANGHRS
jgi:hypothetical protein